MHFQSRESRKEGPKNKKENHALGATLPPYQPLSAKNQGLEPASPIYVGKAVPAGARKGGFGLGADPGSALFRRLKEHAGRSTRPEIFGSAIFHAVTSSVTTSGYRSANPS